MTADVWIRYYHAGALEETVTFSDAERRIEKRMEEMKRAHLKAGNRIIVQMPNSPSAIITYLAIYRMNAIAVPIHHKESDDRLMYVCSHSSADAIVRPDNIILLNTSECEVDEKLDSVCTIIYTSGTTGEPKGVCLSWANWMSNAKALIEHHRLDRKSVLATPLPLSHCNAHGLAMLTTYVAKCRLVLFDKAPENLLEIISAEEVTILSIVPTILYQLYQANSFWKSHSALKYILTAAAPLKPDLLADVMRDWNVFVIQGYGLSESVNFSTTMPTGLTSAEYREIMFPYPSIGVELPGVSIRLGESDEENVRGEILVKADSNFYGYLKRDSLALKEWVSTGDIGYYRMRNGHRYYYLVGRIKEFINRGGEKISPYELELEISKLLPKGTLYAVITIPDEVYGEDVGIACTQSFDASLLEPIPRYRRPKRIYLVNELFYAANGKMLRRRVSEFCNEGKAQLIWKTYA